MLLTLAMLIALAACGDNNQTSEDNAGVVLNETISSDSKWINSSIIGAIDRKTSVSEKDDYFTAVNKNWILAQDTSGDEKNFSIFSECDAIIKERKLEFIAGETELVSNIDNISDEELRHNQKIVSTFAAAAADWETRNASGVEPLRPYIEEIESISSVDELTAYLTDIEGANFIGASLLDISVASSYVDQKTYRLAVTPLQTYMLEKPEYYKNIDLNGKMYMDNYSKEVLNILTKLGYSEADSRNILAQCYEFEGYLVDNNEELLSDSKALEQLEQGRTLKELADLCGNYPIMEILKSRGMDGASEVHFDSDAYMRYLSSMYNDAHLPAIKAYLIATTAKEAARLLDRENYEIFHELYGESMETGEMGTGSEGPAYDDEWDYILNDFVSEYLAGPMDIMYVARYCSSEQKAQILELIEAIKSAFYAMIDGEEWLTEAAKEASYRKLDCLSVRAVYPDRFEDYSDIVFEQGDSLIKMVQKTKCHNIYYSAKLIDVENDRSVWDMDEMPTTTVNAFYMPNENSINILAGILSVDQIYSVNNSEEQNLAGIGIIIGHEITHGFDDNGCKYDEHGMENEIWSVEDKSAFMLRTGNLKNYYSSLCVCRGGALLSGTKLSGEAIADMGGMKLTLIIADSCEEFDYKMYFTSYGKIWKELTTKKRAEAMAGSDVHPPNFLRTNVTVMQFEQFYDTYGVTEGDGMYMAPDKRIAVW